jgi:signal transduction histidine kinase
MPPEAPFPSNEKERLRTLLSQNLLDTPSEEMFNELVELAATLTDMPIALISLLDTERLWFKARHGLEVDEVPRTQAFCAYTILDSIPLIVEDASQDPRFADNPLVLAESGIRFYAGIPLEMKDGSCLGSLCVLDRQKRTLNTSQIASLKLLARQVVRLFEQRLELQQSANQDSLQRQLTRVIGSDLRNPIWNAEVFLEILDRQGLLPSHAARDIAERMHADLHQSSHLLERLLAWIEIRQQHREGQAIAEEIELRPEVVRALHTIRTPANVKQLELVNAVPEGLKVWGHRPILTFVLHHLLHNALRFTERGHIAVTASQQGPEIHITVADTGMGISAERQTELFDWSRRQTLGDQPRSKGLGLGLLMSQELLRLEQGQLWCESTLGIGSQFHFRLLA